VAGGRWSVAGAMGYNYQLPSTNYQLPSTVLMNQTITTSPITDGSQVIAHDGYDVQDFAETVTCFPKLARTVSAAQQQVITGTALLRDLYWSFHKANPRLAPAAVSPVHEINQQIMAEIMSTSEWRDLRELGTVGDAFASALATTGAGEKAIATLGAETMEQMNQLAALTSESEKFLQQAESLTEISALTPQLEQAKQYQKQASTARKKATQRMERAEQLRDTLTAKNEERSQAVRQAARRGLRDALQEIEAVNAAMEAFGNKGFSSGANHQTTREKLQLAQELQRNPKLQQIAAACGRFKRIAWQQQKSRVKHSPDEIVSLTQGNDLARLLPGELALLASPETEDLFYVRFAEQSLLQYNLQGSEPQQGPIILALDESGSMNEICGGMTKEVWSKSVMLGMLAIARSQQRDFAVIHFSGAAEIRVDRFPKGLASTQEVINCAGHFYSGGTVFHEWMEAALHLVHESAFAQADCICLSDGVGDLHADTLTKWRQTKQERGMRAYSILIGSEEGVETLNEFSDSVFCLDDLADDLPALETIFSI
jgi:uncharacterized protein with von Willebrand factor type A (vWA) domain